MNLSAIHIDNFKLMIAAAWFVAALVVIMGFRYIKALLIYVLVKLYELFIQHNPV